MSIAVRPFRAGAAAVAGLSGFALALVTSATLVGDRINTGSLRTALLGNLATTALVLAVVLTFAGGGHRSERSPGIRGSLVPRGALVPQLVGLALGIALVHWFVRAELRGGIPWLAERPAQLVNDAVAGITTLALVRAGLRRRIDPCELAAAAVLVVAYASTASWWHLDAAPLGFTASVQSCVVAQFASIAVAVLLFRGPTRTDDAR